MLASNNLTELSDLDVLGKFVRLTHLVLLDNPVTKKEVGLSPPPCVDAYNGVVLTIWSLELPVLGSLALPDGSVFRLPEGQAGREGESYRALRDS